MNNRIHTIWWADQYVDGHEIDIRNYVPVRGEELVHHGHCRKTSGTSETDATRWKSTLFTLSPLAHVSPVSRFHRCADSQNFDSCAPPHLEEIGGGGFFQKDFEPAIAVDEQGWLLHHSLTIAIHSLFNNPLAYPNEQLSALRKRTGFFKMGRSEV